jgi:hypothetical protein
MAARSWKVNVGIIVSRERTLLLDGEQSFSRAIILTELRDEKRKMGRPGRRVGMIWRDS